MIRFKEIEKDLYLHIGIIIFCLAVSMYMIKVNSWHLNSSEAIAFYLCTFGYVILALFRFNENNSWKKNVLPAFSVVQKSLANSLVLLSPSRTLKDAYELSYHTYKKCSDHKKVQEGFFNFLENVAPKDFEDGNHQKGEMPFGPRVEELIQKVLVPIRDLLRWGMVMDRLYVLRDSDRRKKRLGISLLELVVNLYVVECERVLEKIVDENIYYNVTPKELNCSNISFAEIGFAAGEEDPFHFDTPNDKISEGAKRLIIILNEMSAKGIDLSQFASIPDYPYCKKNYEEKKEFIEIYLTLAWFRSVMDCMGWEIVTIE